MKIRKYFIISFIASLWWVFFCSGSGYGTQTMLTYEYGHGILEQEEVLSLPRCEELPARQMSPIQQRKNLVYKQINAMGLNLDPISKAVVYLYSSDGSTMLGCLMPKENFAMKTSINPIHIAFEVSRLVDSTQLTIFKEINEKHINDYYTKQNVVSVILQPLNDNDQSGVLLFGNKDKQFFPLVVVNKFLREKLKKKVSEETPCFFVLNGIAKKIFVLQDVIEPLSDFKRSIQVKSGIAELGKEAISTWDDAQNTQRAMSEEELKFCCGGMLNSNLCEKTLLFSFSSEKKQDSDLLQILINLRNKKKKKKLEWKKVEKEKELELKKMEEEKAELREKIVTLNKELERLQQEISTHLHTETLFNIREDSWTKMKNALMGELQDHKKELLQVKAEMASLKSKIVESDEESTESSANAEKIVKKNEKQVKELEELRASYQKELAEHARSRLTIDICKLAEESREQLEKKLHELEVTCGQLKKQLKAKEAINQSLIKHNEQLESMSITFESLREEKEENRKLQQKISRLNSEKDFIMETLKERQQLFNEEISAFKEEIIRLNAENNQLGSEKDSSMQSNELLEEKFNEFKLMYNTLEDAIKQHQITILDLVKENGKLDKKSSDFESLLEEEKEKNRKSQQEITQLSGTIIWERDFTIHTLKETNSKLNGEKVSAIRTLEELQARKRQLEEKISALENSLFIRNILLGVGLLILISVIRNTISLNTTQTLQIA